MNDAVIAWFWQPPIDGQPGLMMICDMHPGPDHPDIPMVIDTLPAVLAGCETQIPEDVSLYSLRIYVRDVAGFWMQVEMNALSRRFKSKIPEVPDAELSQLWYSREEPDERVLN